MFHFSYSDVLHTTGNALSRDEIHRLSKKIAEIPTSSAANVRNGIDFLSATEKYGVCDVSSWSCVTHKLKEIGRYDLLHLYHVRARNEVRKDLLEGYVDNSKKPENCKEVVKKCNKKRSFRTRDSESASIEVDTETPAAKKAKKNEEDCSRSSSDEPTTAMEIRERQTCELRLHIRAEFAVHESALDQGVSSNNQDPIENQLECFSQASGVLRGRELGCIVCQVQFAEITYLDAFWRDYLNGTLLEALKGVFITETLRRAVGDEPIRLLVHVDTENYQRARKLLIKNLDP